MRRPGGNEIHSLIEVISGIALFAVLGGLLYALWAVIRNSRQRTRRIAAQLGGPITPTTTPVVVRSNRKATAGAALFFAWLLALAIRTMLLGDAPVGIVIGLLAVWGIVHFVRLSVHETPVLMVDGDGFWTPSEGRLPWDAVEQVRVDEWSSRGVSHYDLIFELAAWAHHQEDVEISLSMLSMSWNDIVAAVQARIGRRVTIRHPSLLGRIRPQRESGQRAQP